MFQKFKTSLTTILIVALSAGLMQAQDTTLLKQLEESQYLRKVMKEEPANAGMTRCAKKKVNRSRILPLAGNFEALKTSGAGTIQIAHNISRSDAGSVLLQAPASTSLKNPTNHVMPAPGRFDGQHYVTLYPNERQQIIWEIPDLYRDSVSGFSVNIMLGGSPMGASDSMKLYIDDMESTASKRPMESILSGLC